MNQKNRTKKLIHGEEIDTTGWANKNDLRIVIGEIASNELEKEYFPPRPSPSLKDENVASNVTS
jgi:hypothetical protein